jgi:hypothetical protein
LFAKVFIFLCLVALAYSAEDAGLTTLQATLAPLRAHANDRMSNDHAETRGAAPVLTIAKHQLRDWIEMHLAKFPQAGDIASLAAELHAGLSGAGLFCDSCFPSFLGYVDDVQVNRDQEFLIVRTSTGIWCGFDDSAYVYRWRNGRWQRIWQHEQTNYTSQNYLPQILYSVHVSPLDRAGRHLVLTLGSRPGCSVAFQPVYYSLWRMDRAKALLQRSEFAYIGEFPPIKGSVGADDALIEFTRGGTGYGEGHEAVRHYKVRGNVVTETDPIAPNPRDFVEEWLAMDWEQSSARSESRSLEAAHAKLHREDGMGDFPDATKRCRRHPDLWQVGLKLHGVPGETWYLVRAKPPDHFSMVSIANQPDPDCSEAAGESDWPRTLFPGVN